MGSRYIGRSSACTDLILPDGRPISSRAISKIRNAECGQRYAMEDLIRAGARAQRFGEDRGEWMASLERTGLLTRGRLPGCNAYLIPLPPAAVPRPPFPLFTPASTEGDATTPPPLLPLPTAAT